MLASVAMLLMRAGARRIERHLTEVTALQFASALTQTLAYLCAFVLYAHLVPGLRALGTPLLAGVSVVSVVVSVVVGLAAQNTLGNLIAGFSLVHCRQVRGSSAGSGPLIARVRAVSLGFTVLREDSQREVIVPSSVMTNTTLLGVALAGEASRPAPG